MKTRLLFLLLFAILFIGCNDEIVTKIDTQSFDTEQAEKLLSPFKNYISNFKEVTISKKSENATAVTKTIKFHSSSGTFEFIYPSTECPDEVQVLIIGEGNASHLGHFTVKNTYCSDFSQNPTTPIRGLLTAANGDMINTMVISVNYDPEIGFIYDYIVVSGTGRFEGVTGYLTMYGLIDIPNLFWSLKGEGLITY